MAYEHTKVNYMKTQGQIGELLSKHGIMDKVFFDKASENELQFIFKKPVEVNEEKFDLGVKIILTDINESNRNTKYRRLFYWLKNKFEIINENMFGNPTESFIKEFFAYLIIGKDMTIYDKVGMEYYKAITEKKISPNLQLGFGGAE